ncbi:MAG: S8 family serine peptidase [Anaerolineae bacterium]|nr:S8 family serine peptidase [Anaerolineae bacterium]
MKHTRLIGISATTLLIFVWGVAFLLLGLRANPPTIEVPTLASLSQLDENQQIIAATAPPVLDFADESTNVQQVDIDNQSPPQNDIIKNHTSSVSEATANETTISIDTQNIPLIDLPDQEVPNTVVIQFEIGTDNATLVDYAATFGGTVESVLRAVNTAVISLPPTVTSVPPAPFIEEETEPDYYIMALEVPNDPDYPTQWNLEAVNAHFGWHLLPADASVTVAVIDSGVCFENIELQGRLLNNGWDFVDNDADPTDEYGHGCGVAGVLAANMNNAIGIAGVAPHVDVMPLRVLDASGIGTYSRVAKALIYAVDNGTQIINLSLGGTSQSTLLANAIAYADERGVVVIAAAGNSGSTQPVYPAAIESVIAVGSVDADLGRSSFSNYGTWVDLYAPGRSIRTIGLNGLTNMSGTSLAAPHVAGIAAIEMALGRSLVVAGGIAAVQDGSNSTPVGGDDEPVACDNSLIPDLLAELDVLVTQYLTNPSSVSETELDAARQAYRDAAVPCYTTAYGATLQFDGGGQIPSYSEPTAQYRLFGTKWGEDSPFEPDNPPASSGGVVTYSFMPGNVTVIEGEPVNGVLTTSWSEIEVQNNTCNLIQYARDVFTEWGAEANITFVYQETDSGDPFNSDAGNFGHIRIGFIPIDGFKNELGHAYFPGPDPMELDSTGVGDILLDTNELWGCETLTVMEDTDGDGLPDTEVVSQLDFGVVLRHEVGHAIGLSHQGDATLAVMNADYNGTVEVLQTDDVTGLQAIYGNASLGAIPLLPPTTITSNQVTLEWIEDTADFYQIQITTASDPTFATPFLDHEQTDTIYETGVLSVGNYLWRVRGYIVGSGWGQWSGETNALFMIDTGIPTLIRPLNGIALRTGNVEFRWGEVAGVTTFELEIADSSNFAASVLQTLLVSNDTNGNIIIHQLSGSELLEDGSYFWRVRASQPSVGEWSRVWQFRVDSAVPTPLFPPSDECQPLPSNADVAWCTTNSLTMEWTPVDGAVEYEVIFDTAANFVGVLFMDTQFLQNLFMDTLFMDTLFMDTLFMDTLSMDTLFMDTLFMDTLFMDTLFMDTLFMDTLFMDTLFMDTLFMDTLFMDTLFMDTLFMDTIQDNNVAVPNFTDGYHYWRVRAVREDGTFSPWSEANVFIVDTDRNDIVISEIYLGNSSTLESAWFEITNASPREIGTATDLTDWLLIAYNPDGTEMLRYTFDPLQDSQLTPDLLTFEPGEYLVLMGDDYPGIASALPNTIYLGADTLNWSLNSVTGLSLSDADGTTESFSLNPNEQFVSVTTDTLSSYNINTISQSPEDEWTYPSNEDSSASSDIIFNDTSNSRDSTASASIIIQPSNSSGNSIGTRTDTEFVDSIPETDAASETITALTTVSSFAVQAGPNYTVNTTDMTDDGVCDDVHCSLIEAINAANADGVDSTIDLQASATYTLTAIHNILNGENGLPSITSTVIVNGNNALITRDAGSPDFRILHVDSGGNLTIDAVTLTNGLAADSLFGGGAILNNNILTVQNSTLNGNTSDTYGGAIYSDDASTLIIENTTFDTNTATNNAGGAIYLSEGFATVTSSTFTNNTTATGGGAIDNDNGSTLIVTDSTFTGNQANGLFTGGAIASNGTLTIASSTFDTNTGAIGGAIYSFLTGGTIHNTTFNNNSSNLGGAIFIQDNSASLDITHSTFVANTADTGGTIYALSNANVQVKNSILAQSIGACFSDGTGTFVGLGVNYEDTDTSCDTVAGNFTLVSDVDLALGALTNNGGITQTFALESRQFC